MIRTIARTRAFPALAWIFLAGLGVQIFFAGMYVFVGASNIELHRNFAHVLLLTSVLLTISVFAGRVPEKRMLFLVLGLFVIQGMLVHVNQWFGLSMVAALHPVNAVVMAYAALTLAKRSGVYWAEDLEPMRVTGAMEAAA
ncbi:MAG TPA: DUF6220 domain-containing protein [Candidatus Limnocylindria bacterium]|nr:DUF6220 domain-containing protein [Candidatus Limnocylindria bacterium]